MCLFQKPGSSSQHTCFSYELLQHWYEQISLTKHIWTIIKSVSLAKIWWVRHKDMQIHWNIITHCHLQGYQDEKNKSELITIAKITASTVNTDMRILLAASTPYKTQSLRMQTVISYEMPSNYITSTESTTDVNKCRLLIKRYFMWEKSTCNWAISATFIQAQLKF